MKKFLFTLISVTTLLLCLSLFSACNKDNKSTSVPEQDKEVEFVPLTIENFSFEIPSYWLVSKKTDESIQYYAEIKDKVAMLTISYGVDEKDPVTWQMLYDERDLMVDAIESSMKSMDCKVSSYEEVISNYGEKGLLYKYRLNMDVDDGTLPGEGCWYCIPSEEDNRWIFINYAISENVEYQNYAEDFLKLIASVKCNYVSSDDAVSEAKFEITVTMSEEELRGLTTEEAETKLKEMGFVKFQHESLDTDKDVDLDDKVSNVEIKKWKFGKGDFSKGDAYNKDAIVVIWSYKYKEPEKQRPVSYSTNDYENAKKGNTGVFAYKKSGAYDIYWIIDFNEGYAYWFTEGNGETTCDKVKIVSGDLNDKIIVTWHDGNEQWSWGIHFKYVNHPETLVINDHNGFDTEFTATNLDNAIALRDKKTIKNY